MTGLNGGTESESVCLIFGPAGVVIKFRDEDEHLTRLKQVWVDLNDFPLDFFGM